MESQVQIAENEKSSNIHVHAFSDILLESPVNFHVIKLMNSVFIWIGTTADLTNLAVAMQTKYETGVTGSNIMGDMADMTSSSLAQKLAKKTKKQVFVSQNVSSDLLLLPLIEKRIFTELATNPDKF